MVSYVVVDSGTVVSTAMPEALRAAARALVGMWQVQGVQMAAPILFRYEIIAVMRKVVFQKRISLQEAVEARDKLLALSVELHMDDALHKRAYELATQLDRPTAYDSQYLALAERLGCDFWTADEKLFNAVRGTFDWVKWVGSFTPPDSAES